MSEIDEVAVRAKAWHDNGVRYGFPKCCVDEFVGRLYTSSLIREKRKLDGTGFVPCVVCNETKTEEQLVQEIAVNRNHGLPPFPHSRSRRWVK